MDLVIRHEVFSTVVNGETVTMQMRPLKRAHMIALSPYFEWFKTEKEIKKMAPGERFNMQEKMFEMQGMCKPILDKCIQVESITNLTVNGVPATTQDIVDEPAFVTLCILIISELISRSQLTRADEKN